MAKFKIQNSKFKNENLRSYGSGIFVDYGELDFDNRKFGREVKIQASFGELKTLKKAKFIDRTLIDENQFFSKTAKSFSSGYVLHLTKENIRHGLLELDIRQLSENALAYLLIKVEDDCVVNILETLSVIDYSGLIIELEVGQNATVNYHALQNLGSDKFFTVLRQAKLSQGSKINWFEFNLGGKFIKSSIASFIDGENASSQINTVAIADDKQHYDLYNSNIHQSAQTSSGILGKAILNDHSKVLYRGLIRVEPQAIQSTGSQRQDTLLLAPTAEIDAVPDLEIQNNQVRCSHAVTTQMVDKEKLFYLNSRGLNQIEARKALIQAHLMPVIQKIQDEKLHEKILEQIEIKLR